MDFSAEIDNQKSWRYNIAIAVMIVFIISMIIHFFIPRHTSTKSIIAHKTLVLPLKPQPFKINQNIPLTDHYIIQNGDTLAKIFQRQNLSATLLAEILKSREAARYLDHLTPNQTVEITQTATHQLQQLIYNIDTKQYLIIQLENNRPIVKIQQRPMIKTIQFKSGVIHHSLTEAAEKAGLTTSMVKQLSTMFAGQINLSRDVHPGDRFNVLYHEYFINGQKDHPGNIVAAEIIDHEKHYRVVRFVAPHHQNHYYLPNGEAIGSFFLKVPLHYNHVSSGFTYHRFDPYLHEFRSHLGVDYAASPGTPVKAIGNGHVVFSGWMHGYGKSVIIRYGHIYKTLYGHLEKFAIHLRRGEVVKKGQIVGYVGSTGWATGPHLHFELYKNNVPINPVKVKLFKYGSEIPVAYRAQFLAESRRLFSQMTTFENAEKIQPAQKK